MKVFNQKNKHLSKQSGFSLIEMMVSIVLGLLIMLAVMKVFSDNLTSTHMQSAFARVQENGRMATQFLSRDIRGADYWGCGGELSTINNHLDAGNDYSGDPLIGINDTTARDFDGVSVKTGTDILTLKGASTITNAKVTSAMTSTTSSLTVNAGTGITKNDVLLINNCSESDLFTNTSGASTSITPNEALSHVYSVNSQLMKPFVKVYFIGESGGDNHSLYRVDNNVAYELVRGVSDMQIVYGEDTSGNGSVNQFVDADSVSDMDNVLSIRVSLTAVSGDSVSGEPLERTFEVTSNIRNRTLQ